MRCVECKREREPSERGWVVVFTRPDDPRISYCSDCVAALDGGASRKQDEQDEQDD